MLKKKSDGSLDPQLTMKKKKNRIYDEKMQPVRNKTKKRKSEHSRTEDTDDFETVADNHSYQSKETEERPSPAKKERKQKATEGQKSTNETNPMEDRRKLKNEKRKENLVETILDKKAAAEDHCNNSSEKVENPPILKKERKPNSEEGNKSMEANAMTTTESTTNGGTEDDGNKKKKRKKKKKKKQQPVIPKDQDLMSEKCTSYLKEWKENRSAWKFQKLFQIWLIQNMLDDSRVPEDIFPVFLEYISAAKGHTVKIINEKATKLIEEAEKNEAEFDDPKLVRARNIIQSISVD